MLIHSFYLFIQQILGVLSTGETEGEQLKEKKKNPDLESLHANERR